MSRSKWMSIIAVCIASSMAHAEPYPQHKVVLVVPYPAGGGVDTTARIVGQYLSQALKQPFVVENRPGPGGTIGAAYVAHSKPDGYTLLVGGDGPLTLAPYFIPGMPYKPAKDLTGISLLVTIPQILVVKAKGKFKDFHSFLESAKKNSLTIAGTKSSGQELAFLMLKKNAQLPALRFIPYKGTANSVTGLLSDSVDAAFVDPSAMGLVHSGKLKALALTTPARSQANPGIPTLIEEGIPNAAFPGFYALSTPMGTSPEVIQILNQAVRRALAQDTVRKKLMQQGLDPTPTSPTQANAFVANQVKHAGELLTTLDH